MGVKKAALSFFYHQEAMDYINKHNVKKEHIENYFK